MLQRKNARETKDRILRNHPTVRRIAERDYEFIPGFLLEVDQHALRRLLADDDVTSIEENEYGERTLRESTSIIGSSTAYANGFDGSGQTIAIIDDGVASAHPFFGTRVKDDYSGCYSGTNSSESICPNGGTTEEGPDTAEPCAAQYGCNHGTQVAGIAAGRHPTDTTFYGVAPAAQIVPIQVYSRLTAGSLVTIVTKADLLAGLNRVLGIRQHYTFAAVNLSMRLQTNYSTRTDCISSNDLLDGAVSSLRANEIAVVAAIGNKANSSDPHRIVAPACLTDAISVGATTDGDAIAAYGYVQSYIDFFAPGGRAVYNPGLVMTPGEGIETSTAGSGYIESIGTSFAAPHVAGAFAVLREAWPSDTIDRLESDLKLTGTPITISPGVDVPRINVNAARLADRVAPTTPGSFTAVGSAGSVSLSWTASTDTGSSIKHYEISRRATRTAAFQVLTVVTTTSHTDTAGISASKMYEYRIVAVDTFGNRSNAAADYAVTVVFTDDLTTDSQRIVRGRHLAELREAADAWREFALLSRVHTSYSPQTGAVTATDFAGTTNSVREALNAARQQMSLSDFVYSGDVSAPSATASIRKEHVLQLRNSMK